MKLLKEISKNTFAEKITKKYSTPAKIFCNRILLPLILICFIMMIISNFIERFPLALIFFICWLIFLSLFLIIHHQERMRIIKKDSELESIIIRETFFYYPYDSYDYAKFSNIMKEKTTEILKNKEGIVSKSLTDMLIAKLEENKDQHIKKYITFGVILAFLVNPFFTHYSEKFVDYTLTNPLYLAWIANTVLAGLIYLAYIFTNIQSIYLGLVKGHSIEAALIEQLYDIKADILLNSDRSVKRSPYSSSSGFI